MMMQEERPIGDIRRKSVDIGRFFSQRLADDRYYKGDHWQCVESPALNDLLVRLCRSWSHSNAPIVTSRPTLWPFVTRIEMRGYDCEATFDFRPTNEMNTTEASLQRLRDFIREFGTHSSYGRPLGIGFGRSRRDSVTSYDVSIRRSLEIRAAAPSMQTVLFDAELRKMMSRLLRSHWGVERTSLRFNKLSLYERGDRFEFHRDTVHGLAHIGTLEVSLESKDLCGGHLSFRNFDLEPMRDCHYDDEENGKDKVLKLSEYRARDMVKIHAFYTDTEHRIEPVNEGYRVSIEYDIIKVCDDDIEDSQSMEKKVDDYSEYEYIRTLFNEETKDDIGCCDINIQQDKKDDLDEPHTNGFYSIFDEPEMSEKCAMGIVELLNKAPRTAALMMSHLYPLAGVTRHVLRGFDKLLFDALEPHFDIEFMPVFLMNNDDISSQSDDIDMKCVSLQRRGSVDGTNHKKRKSHSLILYITPCAVNCAEKIGEAYLDNFDGGGRFNYTTMAMILNKASGV